MMKKGEAMFVWLGGNQTRYQTGTKQVGGGLRDEQLDSTQSEDGGERGR